LREDTANLLSTQYLVVPMSTEYVAKSPDSRGYIAYTEEENQVWHDLYASQRPKVELFSAPEYLDGLDRLDLPTSRIPQCAEISNRLGELTGWKVEPVPALIGFQQFFSMLANRSFPAASFIRKRRHFDYIEEPDIFHEIFGHTPLLADRRFADFSQAIGRAGCRASAEDYSWLVRLYWFTIEFGLTGKAGHFKALGSGLASSPTELPYSIQSPLAQRELFDVIEVLRTPYRIDIHQPLYYVLESVDELFEIMQRDLLADIAQARRLGLFKPLYPAKTSAPDLEKAS